METEQSELEKRNIQRLSAEKANQLSRECLRAALFQLLSEKDFQKITVTELVKQAGVSRATFYRIYGTKEALLSEISDRAAEQMNSYLQSPRTPDDAYLWSLEIFRRLKDDTTMAKRLVSLKPSLAMVFAMSPLTERENPPRDLKTHYWNLAFEGAVLNIVKDWILHDMPQTPEEMAEICTQIFFGEQN